MKKVKEKINQLTLLEIADLERNCTTIVILDGTKTCTTHSLEKYVEKLSLAPKQILKWFTKTRKKYLKRFLKKA